MPRVITLGPDLAVRNAHQSHKKENTMIQNDSINAILAALASQRQHGGTSLIVTIEPDLIQDAVNALRDYRKLFAPVISGVTDTAPIHAAYEKMRARVDKQTILLFVECQTMEEFREALGRMPIRKSSEWRSLDDGHLEFVL